MSVLSSETLPPEIFKFEPELRVNFAFCPSVPFETFKLVALASPTTSEPPVIESSELSKLKLALLIVVFPPD